jgi:hypothetical protein
MLNVLLFQGLMGNLGLVQSNPLGMFGQQMIMPGFNTAPFGQVRFVVSDN